MYDCMLKSTNSILLFLISMNDCQCILAKNVRHICDKWKILKADRWKNCKSKKLSVFSENEIRECEVVVEMIKELSKGINRFNEDDIQEYFCKCFSSLSYIRRISDLFIANDMWTH